MENLTKHFSSFSVIQKESSIDGKNTERIPVFEPEELKKVLMPTLKEIERQSETLSFRRFSDLSAIKQKLTSRKYSEPWEFLDDVWVMFHKALLRNRKTSRDHQCCTRLAELFEQEIDPVMQALGYCCGRKYTFNTRVLCCYGTKSCTIPKDAKYFSYQNRYTFCKKCFNDIPGDTVTLDDEQSQSKTQIKKDQFIELKNDHLDPEPFVNCLECGRKQHQICVLYLANIWPDGFVCDNCIKMKGAKREENKFSAKRLPVTMLGDHIQTRVNTFLKEKEAGAGKVHIRVLSSFDKMVKVKPGMRNRFVESGELNAEFPYRSKSIFAFEEQDGLDVCFFGMHVQEYGSECPNPNTRRVYIAYLDSVNFFEPKQYRTSVYHEILLGYMDYVKQLGYTMVHIWACPPSENDEFIFHCHPMNQKVPKPKMLQEWYKKMLDKAVDERIIVEYTNILKQAMEDKLTSAAELPYFEGDFWPNILEENIKKLDKKRKQAAAAEQQTGNDLSLNMFDILEKHKEMFFNIRLNSTKSSSLAPIHDPDPLMTCDLMDGRDAFLRLARDKNYEFSSLRRAQFSTLCMLYELYNQGRDKRQGQEKSWLICNNCYCQLEESYHCRVCNDYDLCLKCKEDVDHQHTMYLFP